MATTTITKAKTSRTEGKVKGISHFESFLQTIHGGERSMSHPYVLLLGLETSETNQLLKQVEQGLPYRSLVYFHQVLDIPMNEMADLAQIKIRTLSRRKARGRLEPDESDRLLRVARVFGKALELFEGDDEAARRWFSKPHKVLGGMSPAEMSKTDIGGLEVERLIGRLEHGVFS
jgi:putative toxin-antitoxin system antitoxin component (TIGR02293 family)